MVPGIDMLRLFMTRIYNKKNPFKGDLNHLHHLLKNKFNNLLKTNLMFNVFILLIFHFCNVDQNDRNLNLM